MELTDIESKREWARFEKELFDRFHINCTTYNTAGMAITGKPNWCNRLCPKVKANKDLWPPSVRRETRTLWPGPDERRSPSSVNAMRGL